MWQQVAHVQNTKIIKKGEKMENKTKLENEVNRAGSYMFTLKRLHKNLNKKTLLFY